MADPDFQAAQASQADKAFEHEDARSFNVGFPQDVDWAMQQKANAGPTMGGGPAMGGGPQEGLIGGSGYQQEDKGVQDSPVISVDTFEDMQKGASRSPVYRGYPGPKQGKPGSVNLAPIGRNVGYKGTRAGGPVAFDSLDESTKAAVEMVRIQSQGEDETENAIAQINNAFQSIMGKAQKNTTNRSEAIGGNIEPDQ